MRDLGRRTAVSQAWIGYRPFAERLGYSLAQTQVERRQRLPMDEATLVRLEAEAAGHSYGYTLQTVVGPIPDELVPGFLDLYNLMNVEMPTGDIELEEGRRTPEVQAAQEEELLEQGRTRLTVLAYSPAGEAVATPTSSPAPPTATTPASTSGRPSCAPTTAATGWGWP